MATYKQLKVWKLAVSLMTEIYDLTKDNASLKSNTSNEAFGLIDEIRYCAYNIHSSIAEGAQKRSSAKFLSYLKIANSASIELDTKLRIAKDLGELATKNIRNIRRSFY